MRKIYLLKTWAWLGEEVIIQAVLISAKMNQQGTAGTNLKTNDRDREFCETCNGLQLLSTDKIASIEYKCMSFENNH